MNIVFEFLSTPSARRATYKDSSIHTYLNDFYPRPPRGGRLCRGPAPRYAGQISIHALREEGDVYFIRDRFKELEISIHALREEGDRLFS